MSIDAGSLAFQLYNGNHIIDNVHENCGNDLNHAVTVVGYNEEDKENPYWIVRNSWGDDWGDGGYVKIAIVPGEGVCGIQIEPTYPNVYILHRSGRQASYLILTLIGGIAIVPLTAWLLKKKRTTHSLLFFHPGQEGLMKLLRVEYCFFLFCALLFAITFSRRVQQYQLLLSTIYIFFGGTHMILVFLHFLIGRKNTHQVGANGQFGMGKRRTVALGCILLTMSIVALFMIMLSSFEVSFWDRYDNFEKFHSFA